MQTSRRRRVKVVFALLLLAAAAIAVVVYRRLTDDKPVDHADIREHFKYGSTGGERGWKQQFGFGIPYWIWVALPELFPDLLPDGQPGRGYSSFGMIYEADRDPRFDLPIGMSMRRVQGVDRTYFNCASCHTGSLRDAPDAAPRIILGMPANTFDLGRLGLFLDRAAKHRKFRPAYLMAKIRQLERLRDEVLPPDGSYRPRPFPLIDRLLFRYIGVFKMRDQLLGLLGRLSFIDFSSWGPGRVDTFNSPKALLGFPMDDPQGISEQELMGNADFPSIWNQKARKGMWLHWDGNNCSVDERNLSAGFGTGATPATLDKERLLRTADWLWEQAQPPDFPPERIDGRLAEQGEPIYREYCWECHGYREPPYRRDGDGGKVGQVTPIAEIRTDRSRLDSYTRELAAAQGSLYAGFPRVGEDECRDYFEGVCRADLDDEEYRRLRDKCYPARFTHFRKTDGYSNMPLDGIWLRAPYLHNGSVPDLESLLEPAALRPQHFNIGYDVYDYERVGFVSRRCCSEETAEEGCIPAGASQPCVAAEGGWHFDTRAWGNGNGGHEGAAYGTELDPAEKAALIEYLKTF